jgi:hypothetical protein
MLMPARQVDPSWPPLRTIVLKVKGCNEGSSLSFYVAKRLNLELFAVKPVVAFVPVRSHNRQDSNNKDKLGRLRDRLAVSIELNLSAHDSAPGGDGL